MPDLNCDSRSQSARVTGLHHILGYKIIKGFVDLSGLEPEDFGTKTQRVANYTTGQ